MSYDLHAVIGEYAVLSSKFSNLGKAKVILLNQPALALIPITVDLRNAIDELAGKSDASSGGSIFERLSPGLVNWLKSLSTGGSIAYVEAEFFGGAGAHCAVVWKEQRVIFGPLMTKWGYTDDALKVSSGTEMAINKALRLLGVAAGGQSDEFDAVGLGRCRHTENW